MGLALLLGTVAGLAATIVETFASKAVIRSNGWIAMLIYAQFGPGYTYLVSLTREPAL